MKLQKAKREKVKIKMALQGSSGSGKTMSSILLSKGLANGDLSSVAIVDCESGSSNLYANLGGYNVLNLEPPYTPKKYIEAIDVCINSGMEVVVLDGISNCWKYLLNFHATLPGNSFVNWGKVKKMQDALVDKILQSPIHIIATMRSKQSYVLNLINGKYVPEKVGLKAIQQNEIQFEFDLVFDINIKHLASVSKNRTNLFQTNQEFKISETTGRLLLNWCNSPNENKDVSPSNKIIKSEVNSQIIDNVRVVQPINNSNI